ncbi:MAG: putative lipid II flippase FtsW [Alphaproteobacteria bacterium]
MIGVPRTDSSVLGRWWWTVDHWVLWALAILIGFGAVLALAASPPVADRLGLEPFYFARRQLTVLPAAVLVMIGVSLLSPRWVRRLAWIVFLVGIVGVAATLVTGAEVKGARRWITLASFSLQPSEFVKPAFIVVSAWLLARRRLEGGSPVSPLAASLFVLVVGLLALQPDLGMAVVVATVWFGQVFVAGVPLRLVAALSSVGVAGMTAAYFVFPHVTSRVDRFLDPDSGDRYQVTTSLDAFMNGGLFGRGPGEGTVKQVLPDAHADFVLAVAGEEMGLIACLVIVCLFAFIVVRGFSRLLQEDDLYVLLAASGLLAQFGLQALINMGSSLDLIPTKGMTLPFISYGGSSLLALSLGLGMVLALTRRRFGMGATP